MWVQVMGIRHMRMAVPNRRMVVPVAVFSGRHVVMGVQVVPVVMVMGMLVLQRIMVVHMGV